MKAEDFSTDGWYAEEEGGAVYFWYFGKGTCSASDALSRRLSDGFFTCLAGPASDILADHARGTFSFLVPKEFTE